MPIQWSDPNSLWAVLTIVGMFVAAVIAFVPLVPGPLLVWGIGLTYAIATRLEQVGVPALIFMTLFMLLGSTADLWTRYLGLRRANRVASPGTPSGNTCAQYGASVVGGLVGTFFIPVPIVGTVLGAMLGVTAVEMVFFDRPFRDALRVAWTVLKAWLASFALEFTCSMAMIVIFVLALTR